MIFLCNIHGHLVIIVGLGLIGSSVKRRFEIFGYRLIKSWEVRWEDPDFFTKSYITFSRSIEDLKPNKIDMIWCAGKAGFNTNHQDCKFETNHFKSFLLFFIKFYYDFEKLNISLISSAGALFEDKLNVDSSTIPQALRPYAIEKLEQENMLSTLFKNRSLIFRPSNVYGSIISGKRTGLIATLVKNTLLGLPTYIYGNMNLLRDYIWVEDIAKSIVKVVSYDNFLDKEVYFLVSANPMSIYDIHKMVERVTHKRSYIQFLESENTNSMTFSKSLKYFETEDLNYGILKVVESAY